MSPENQDRNVSDELWPTYCLHHGTTGREVAVQRTALIILNCPIAGLDYFERLYNNAAFRLCADGGANRLHDLLASQNRSIDSARPDLIHGDLDSVRDDVRATYESIGVEVSHDPDQYSTDFGKAVKRIVEIVPDLETVLVLGSIGGRVDQGIGLLGELYREQIVRHPSLRFWLFSESSISTILLPGWTTIHTPLADGLIKRNIGILPLYGAAVITTEGFEWDVQDWPTEMGGRMSTSNHIVADVVKVKTDREVVFTVERAVARPHGSK